jgi:hypothetical protein
MSNAEAIYKFIDGLKKEVRTLVTRDQPKTFQESCSFDFSHDASLMRDKISFGQNHRLPAPQARNQRQHSHARGSFQRQHTLTNSHTEERRDDRPRFGRLNHTVLECTKRSQNKSKFTKFQLSSGKNGTTR